MSTATEHTVHGKLDELAGKVKQAFGEATGNDSVANEGAAQQVKGHAEQAYGTIKGAVEDKVAEVKARHDVEHAQTHVENESRAHDIREKIVSTAQNVKERLNDHLNPSN
jgi:uncharacterized protein YjbJ (UPF0337 family)